MIHCRQTAIFIAVVCWLVLALFAIPVWITYWSPAIQFYDSDSWVATPCVINMASTRPTSDGDRWCVELRYDYGFGGDTYHGDRLAFASPRVGASPADLPALPAPGDSICYVDPSHPSRAVLRRDYDPFAARLSWGLAAITALLGVNALWWTRNALCHSALKDGATS